jgi:osmotically-inducible protein OsmY
MSCEERRSDDSIREEIRRSLGRHAELSTANVEVEGGEVTLAGRVRHRDALWLAEGLVELVEGVSLVHNRLRVSSA